MGVVRREGDWRLEKVQDGLYEVTCQKRTELKIVTSEYNPTAFDDERYGMAVPVREVNSFSDAESIFEEMARKGASEPTFGGMAPDGVSQPTGGTVPTVADGDLSDLPPIGVAFVGFLGGGFLISQYGTGIQSIPFLAGTGLILIGVLVLGITYRVYAADGAEAAFDFLLSTNEKRESKTGSSGSDKTPPAPKRLKEDLFFERADQRCEWCDTRVDSPDVHHIEPRSEGGPNEPENLIVLCPNCHRKADRGAISKSKLNRKVSMQMEQ